MDAARRRKSALVQVRRDPHPSDRIQPRIARRFGHIVRHRSDRNQRILLQVPILDHDVDHRVSIRTLEAVAVIIERQAKLPHAGNSLKRPIARIEAEIHAADRKRPNVRPPRVANIAAQQSIRNVNMIVKSQRRMVGPQLLIALAETGVPGFNHVGLAVAVRVFHVHNFTGHRHEHAALPRLYARGKRQIVGKHGRRFEKSVAVLVRQNRNPRALRKFLRRSRRIVAHLHDPHPAFLVEANSHRAHHIRLARYKLNFEPRIDGNLLERFPRRKRNARLLRIRLDRAARMRTAHRKAYRSRRKADQPNRVIVGRTICPSFTERRTGCPSYKATALHFSSFNRSIAASASFSPVPRSTREFVTS